MDEEQLRAVGITCPLEEQVLRLATLTRDCGLDGVVCSAREAAMLRQHLGQDFKLVTPGIRPRNAEVGDQIRVVTPAEAIKLGSSYLVMGRPITKAPDPIAALKAVNAELAGL